jgi:hypothetical protein
MPRIYLHALQVKDWWRVQYLEADLRTSVGRGYHYTDLDRVRDILRRANADAEAWEEFESGIRKWGIGACFLNLTEEQYRKLKVIPSLRAETAQTNRALRAPRR